jgi:hypothetical protein
MPTKPRTAAGYEPTQVAHVRATCLYVATRLGDLADELVIVGGLVPSLLIDQTAAATRHVGTADLDVGLALAHLRCETLSGTGRASSQGLYFAGELGEIVSSDPQFSFATLGSAARLFGAMVRFQVPSP